MQEFRFCTELKSIKQMYLLHICPIIFEFILFHIYNSYTSNNLTIKGCYLCYAGGSYFWLSFLLYVHPQVHFQGNQDMAYVFRFRIGFLVPWFYPSHRTAAIFSCVGLFYPIWDGGGALHKKSSFPITISWANVTKFGKDFFSK